MRRTSPQSPGEKDSTTAPGAMLRLPAECVALAPQVGSAAQRPGLRIDARGDDSGRHSARRRGLGFVSGPPELFEGRRVESLLDLEHARLAPVIFERAEGMEGIEARRLDRFLEPAAEDDEIEKNVQDLLVLAVSSRGRNGEKRLSVL